MKTKITWRQKNKLLLIAAFILGWCAYTFAIRHTLELRSQCEMLQERIDSAKGAPEKIQRLHSELNEIENALSHNSGSSIHERLLDVVTNYCGKNNLLLRDFSS